MQPHRAHTVITVLCVAVLPGCLSEVRSTPPIVALITDYGSRDAYAGVLAGAILRQCPDAHLVTITHEVPAFDVAAGSYLLARAAGELPQHTVTVAVVDPGVGTQRRSIVVRTKSGRLFVGPDNGLFTGVIADQGLARAWEITNQRLLRPGALSNTFHGRDIYGPIGGRLAAGMPPDNVGPVIADPQRLAIRPPARTDGVCTGLVLHVDHYGNVTTNVPAAWLADGLTAGQASVIVKVNGERFEAVYARTYADVPAGALLVLGNAEGRLEIARNAASAAGLLKVTAGSEVEIRFDR
ncbi:MAG: SAM-dependent chlorinase/fluorinase [Phycisphaerales bacterium]|nr:MAG: SAM-dependent chlorinase/fluorinase [Phycisphaerales bacterium]